MHLSQVRMGDRAAVVAREGVIVVAREGESAWSVPGAASTYDLAMEAADEGRALADVVASRGRGEAVDLRRCLEEGRLLPPLDHPRGPHRWHLAGTGLTHLGSAATRDAMHAKSGAKDGADDVTDSMRMFRQGVEGGKPAVLPGAQPEWFHKGNGLHVVNPGEPLESPSFALDGGEEPEVAGLYVIASDGTPARVGWSLGNEFSDHRTERLNYLLLAHSKLRPASYGPEMLLGDLPDHVEGTSRILRAGEVVWQKPFLSGEANMSHSIANLEHHHFKYAMHRFPGDVHVHFLGTATLSFADGFAAEAGDVFEIESAPFGLPLRNPLAIATDEGVPRVRQL